MAYQIPLYIQLKETIASRIKDKEYLPGAKIPSEREMSDTYGINRMTVKKAIDALVEEGSLYRVHGRGTFVINSKDNTPVFRIDPNEDATNQGLGASLKRISNNRATKVLEKGFVECRKYLLDKLYLEENEKIYALHRLREVDDVPFALEYCYMPAKYFDDINDYNFEQVSLYDYMADKGHKPTTFKQTLKLMKAGTKEANILKIFEDDILYYFEYSSYDENGNILEYTRSYMRCDKVIFSFKSRVR